MFELVSGSDNKRIGLVFSYDNSINIDKLEFPERVYFVHGVHLIFDRPKYIEFTSVFSEANPNKTFMDFLNGKKVIYNYTCYDTSRKIDTYKKYEHSLTFVQNKATYG